MKIILKYSCGLKLSYQTQISTWDGYYYNYKETKVKPQNEICRINLQMNQCRKVTKRSLKKRKQRQKENSGKIYIVSFI